MNIDKQNNSENQGLNFKKLVPILSDEYKLAIANNEKRVTEIFPLSEAASKYLTSLIKKEVKDNSNLSINNSKTNQEQPITLINQIKNKFKQTKLWQLLIK